MFEFEKRVLESSAGEQYLQLTLTGTVRIESVTRLKEVLMEAFTKHDHIVLDIGDLTIVGFPFFQLLCATNKYAQAQNKRFELRHQCSEAIIDCSQTVGFLRQQGCPEAVDPDRCLWIAKNM
ncbi:MAG: STAS domain-containing protein [Thermodesulfobacteriota bacterium]|nr:STAS domain-containing protein [Thermodesulfobacteriota bacterium]